MRPLLGATTLFVALLLVPIPVRGNHGFINTGHTVWGHAAPTTQSAVEVQRETLSIRFRPIEHFHTPAADVVADYILVNPTDVGQHLNLGFPISGMPVASYGSSNGDYPIVPTTSPSLNFSVECDGQPVATREVPLVPSEADARAADERAKRYAQLYNAWLESDPQLLQAVREYDAIDVASNDAWDAFRQEVVKHLIDKERAHDFLSYAGGYRGPSSLARLIAEVDPLWRVETGDGKYVSKATKLSEASWEAFAPDWQKKIDAWFAAKPDLKRKADAYSKASSRLREAQAIMDERIVPHLRTRSGLSELTAKKLAMWLRSRNSRWVWPDGSTSPVDPAPRSELLADFLPQVAAEEAQLRRRAEQSYEYWGFDRRFLSVLTGRLYSRRIGWRDDSTWELLGVKPTRSLEDQSILSDHVVRSEFYQTAVDPVPAAKVMQYELTVPARGTRRVVVKYTAVLQTDHPLYMGRSYAIIPQFEYILKTVRHWKSFGPIDVSIVVPPKTGAVITPLPQETIRAEDSTTYRMTLKNPSENLHVALLTNFNLFHVISPNDAADLRKLSEHVTDPMALRVLRAAQMHANCVASPLRQAYGLHELRQDAPEVPWALVNAGISEKEPSFQHALALFRGEAKPLGDIEMVVRRLGGDGTPKPVSEDARFLAAHLAARPTDDLSPLQQLAYHLLVAAGGIEEPRHIAEFLSVAKANPDLKADALKLIEAYPRQRSPFVGYVVRHRRPFDFKDKPWPPALPEDSGAAVIAALGATTDRGYMRQVLMILEHEHGVLDFDALRGLSDHVLGAYPNASDSTGRSFINVLVQSGPAKSPAVLHDLLRRYPRYSWAILPKLGELKDPGVVDAAIEVYQTASDSTEISVAAQVIERNATPAVFTKLHYRKGLGKHVGESLTMLVRSQGGGPEAFDFVAQFYLEHVKGQRAVEHTTCAKAFEKLGDPRALPYLREMLDTCERTTDVAEAIAVLERPVS
jgi:hypothetical protein